MFDNIGGKVKTMAAVFCWIGIIVSIISGLIIILRVAPILGIFIAIFGAFISWLSSLALYAIGESAENSDAILQKLKAIEKKQAKKSTSENADIPNSEPIKKSEPISCGSWWCSCGAANRDTDSSCSVCFKQRPNKK